MATGISVHGGGVWSEYPVPWVRAAGAWRPSRAVYTHAGGAWSQTQGWLLTLVAGSAGAIQGFCSGAGFGYPGQCGTLNGNSTLLPVPGTANAFVYALCNNASQSFLTISGTPALTQSSISYVILNGSVFLASAASFSGGGPYTWTWPASAGISSGNTYNCAASGIAIGS